MAGRGRADRRRRRRRRKRRRRRRRRRRATRKSDNARECHICVDSTQ
jgi:hypothetical protein